MRDPAGVAKKSDLLGLFSDSMSAPNTSASTWAALAALRFALALIVMNAHLGLIYQSSVSFFDLPDFYRFGRRLGPLAAIIGFLFISGYSIAHSYKVAPENFYKRRIIRIYPTLTFTVSIYIICLLVWSPIYTTSSAAVGLPNIGEAVAPFLGLNGISHGSFLGPTWSLSVEILFYIITPIVFFLSRRVLLTVIFASAAVYWLNEELGIGGFPGALYGLAAASLFWAWASGLYFYRFPSIFSAILITIIGSVLLTKFNYEGGVWARQTFGFTVIIVALASLSPLRARLPERLMTYLGDLSFPLFLIHMPVIIIGNGVFGVQSPTLLIVLALALSAFCLHCVERPIQVLLGYRGSHREGAHSIRTTPTQPPGHRLP